MSFFKKIGQEGKQEENISNLEKKIQTLINTKNKAWDNLKNSPTYQQEMVKKGKTAIGGFSSYFQDKGFTVSPADPRENIEKVVANSGQYDFSLLHTRKNTLLFEALGHEEYIYLVDKNSPTNKFNGFIDIDGVFIDGHKYTKDASILEEAIAALEKDIEILEELKQNSYTPQLAFLDKRENVINTIEEYFDGIEEELEKAFESNSNRV